MNDECPMPSSKEYGVVIGRFQPFHAGHDHIVMDAKNDGVEPVIIIGSAQEYGTEKNPHSYLRRAAFIRETNPTIPISFCFDNDDNELWYQGIVEALATIAIDIRDCTFYFNYKTEDRCDFTYRGIEYKNEHYSKIFELEGQAIKVIDPADIDVSGTAIRANLYANREYLHDNVYKYLKSIEGL